MAGQSGTVGAPMLAIGFTAPGIATLALPEPRARGAERPTADRMFYTK